MSKDSETRRKRRASSIADAYRQAHEVMSAGMSIAICAGVGYWLDTKTGWMPVLTIIGSLAGCVAAAVSLR
ncbi:MAG: AtpZ/AtpI family protein, partial [Planctomycetaceae bacterium]|nr:AtpZ/AtpI family protein [Planctomycetaceae bacterium]